MGLFRPSTANSTLGLKKGLLSLIGALHIFFYPIGRKKVTSRLLFRSKNDENRACVTKKNDNSVEYVHDSNKSSVIRPTTSGQFIRISNIIATLPLKFLQTKTPLNHPKNL